MAGYFTKHDGYVYLGSEKAGEELANGLFVSITGSGVKKLTAAGDALFRVVETTVLWGLPAVRMICTNAGTQEVYLTENELEDYLDNGDFNSAGYTVKTGHYVKMRRPAINDELIVSVTDALLATLAVGDIVKPAIGGTIAKNS